MRRIFVKGLLAYLAAEREIDSAPCSPSSYIAGVQKHSAYRVMLLTIFGDTATMMHMTGEVGVG